MRGPTDDRAIERRPRALETIMGRNSAALYHLGLSSSPRLDGRRPSDDHPSVRTTRHTTVVAHLAPTHSPLRPPPPSLRPPLPPPPHPPPRALVLQSGKYNRHVEAAVLAGGRSERGAVGVGDGADDREAEAVTVAVLGAFARPGAGTAGTGGPPPPAGSPGRCCAPTRRRGRRGSPSTPPPSRQARCTGGRCPSGSRSGSPPAQGRPWPALGPAWRRAARSAGWPPWRGSRRRAPRGRRGRAAPAARCPAPPSRG